MYEATAGRIDFLNLAAAIVEEINAMTQRILDKGGPGTPDQEFLAAHNRDTTIPY